jgi:hypothetical protein
MRRSKKGIIAAIAVIGALAAGGAAYTNSIDTSSTTGATAGYGAFTVNGGPALSSVSYTFGTDGSTITGVNLVFANALVAGQHVRVGFNNSASLTDCVPAGVTATANVSCTLGTAVGTTGATSLNVLVADS